MNRHRIIPGVVGLSAVVVLVGLGTHQTRDGDNASATGGGPGMSLHPPSGAGRLPADVTADTTLSALPGSQPFQSAQPTTQAELRELAGALMDATGRFQSDNT